MSKQKNDLAHNVTVLMRHNLTTQYHSVYNARYMQLRKLFKPSVNQLDQIPKDPTKVFSVVATLFVTFAKRDTLITRFKNTDVIKWHAPLHPNDDDAYFLEDMSDHIAIQAPDKWKLTEERRAFVMTGMVACFTMQRSSELSPDGVYRYAVREMIWPGDRLFKVALQPQLPTPKRPNLLILADVRLDQNGYSPLAKLTAKPLAASIAAVVIVGPFASELTPLNDNDVGDVVHQGTILTFAERNADHKLKQMQAHRVHLEKLRQQRPVFIIPSSTDLTSYRLPQRAIDKRLFGFGTETPRLHMQTNPYVLTIAKRHCYITSDLPIRALQHVSPKLKHQPSTILRAIHAWQHVAPCIPDVFACEPQVKTDPLLLPTTPPLDWIVLSMAHMPSFQGLVVNNTIALPSFHHTRRLLSIQVQSKLCNITTV